MRARAPSGPPNTAGRRPLPPSEARDTNVTRRISALVGEILFYRLSNDHAIDRLRGILAETRNDGERDRVKQRFFSFLDTRERPNTFVVDVARVMQEFVSSSLSLTVRRMLPAWVKTENQISLYFFSLIAGYGGHSFGLAQNAVAKALGLGNNGAVKEFRHKALKYCFFEKPLQQEKEPGKYAPMTKYTLSEQSETELDNFPDLKATTQEKLPWVFNSNIIGLTAEERRKVSEAIQDALDKTTQAASDENWF